MRRYQRPAGGDVGLAGMMKSALRSITRRLQRTDKDAAEFHDRCDGCGASFDAEPRAPMLIDATWAKLAEQHETLRATVSLTGERDATTNFSTMVLKFRKRPNQQ